MQFIEEEIDKILNEVKEKALAEGAYTHDSWRTIVDDVLSGHERFHEIEEDGIQNLQNLLYQKFEEFKKGLGAM